MQCLFRNNKIKTSMSFENLSLLLIIVLVSCANSAIFLDTCNTSYNTTSDAYLLCELFYNLDGLPDGWWYDGTGSTYEDNPCLWGVTTGITCDGSDAHVIGIFLTGYAIDGEITSGVSWPSKIQQIFMGQNNLTGTLDVSSNVLPASLETFRMDDNQLTSIIIEQTTDGNLSNVTAIDVSNNFWGNNFTDSQNNTFPDFTYFDNLLYLNIENVNLSNVELDWLLFPNSIESLLISKNSFAGGINEDEYNETGINLYRFSASYVMLVLVVCCMWCCGVVVCCAVLFVKEKTKNKELGLL